jgi:biotin transport system substrate-specific component
MQRTLSGRTVFADFLWPELSRGRDLALVLLGALATALLARMEIPLEPVPITGQTLGVLLTGALLGSRRGAASLGAYLLLGAAGLPMWAGGSAGMARLLGPTGGYLLGFVPAAWCVGWLSERGWDRRVWSTVLAMALGTAVIHLCGVLWLSQFVGWPRVFHVGVLPFLPGDAMKIVLAALALPSGWALARLHGSEAKAQDAGDPGASR